MTDPEQQVDLLNALLDAETRSLLARLGEAAPFVSWTAADEQALVEDLVEEQQQLKAALAECILSLAGSPTAGGADLTMGDLHYVELHHLMPRLVADQDRLVRACEVAAERVDADCDAGRLIGETRQTHEQHLDRLRELQQRITTVGASDDGKDTSPESAA